MPRAAIVAAAVAVLGLALAPAGSNAFWGTNPWASVEWPARIGVVAVAAAAGVLAARVRGGAIAVIVLSAALAWTLAFPLHERIHFLGDTLARQGALATRAIDPRLRSVGEIAAAFHAQPLDAALNARLPLELYRMGQPLPAAISIVSLITALVFFTGAWRVVTALAGPRDPRLGLWLALVLAGTLQAFAGYAESAGILLAASAWWWSQALRPVATTRDALTLGALWLVAFLSHRLGLALLVPLALRAVGPPLEGDAAPARRALAISIGVAGALALAATFATGAAARIGADLSEFFASLSSPVRHIAWPPDTLNLLVVIAPLAWLIPFAAGRTALGEWARTPRARLGLWSLLPLAPLAFHVGATGLGLHRDWDLAALLGWTLTLAAVTVTAALSGARRRGALAVFVPVVAAIALAWVTVNADQAASLRRARALADGPPELAPSQQAQVLLYLAGWEDTHRNFREAATLRERSWRLAPTSNRGLLAARAWYAAGDREGTRRMLDAVRAHGGLDERGRAFADTLERLLSTGR